MSQYYTFHEAGSIPGVPGTFSNCTVIVEDDGLIGILPLGVNAHIVESTGTALTLAEDTPTEPLIDAPVEAVAPVEEAQPVTIVPEPEAAPASPQFYS